VVSDVIRPARAEEARRLSDLAMRSKAYWGYDIVFMEACRAELTVTPGDIAAGMTFVYEDGGRLLDFYRIDIDHDAAVVALFFVEPDVISQGVGRSLWRHMVEAALGRGATTISVASDPNAEGFYRRMGARSVGVEESESIPGRMLPLLELVVSS
jgi:predicted N-acetyltransferase YhbS